MHTATHRHTVYNIIHHVGDQYSAIEVLRYVPTVGPLPPVLQTLMSARLVTICASTSASTQSATTTARVAADTRSVRMDTAVKVCALDECAEGTHNCSNVCVNTLGDFQCGCTSGCQLSESGLICEGTGLVCLLKNTDFLKITLFSLSYLLTCLFIR